MDNCICVGGGCVAFLLAGIVIMLDDGLVGLVALIRFVQIIYYP